MSMYTPIYVLVCWLDCQLTLCWLLLLQVAISTDVSSNRVGACGRHMALMFRYDRYDDGLWHMIEINNTRTCHQTISRNDRIKQ